MKSKMLAISMNHERQPEAAVAERPRRADVDQHPIRVSVFGWTRHRTHKLMMPRNGSMHAAPMAPVKVIGFRAADSVVVVSGTIMEGSDT